MNQYPNLPDVIMPIEETKLQLWLKAVPADVRKRFEQSAETIKPLIKEIHSKRPTTPGADQEGVQAAVKNL